MNQHNGDDLIIERPDLQGWPLVLGSRLITAAMWVLYVYLWLPLLTLLAWAIGIEAAYEQMVALGGYRIAAELWAFFATVILIMGGLLLGWARINFYRFRGPDRRQLPGRTDSAKMAADFGLAPDQLSALQTCRCARLDHHPDSSLRHVELDAVPYPVTAPHSETNA
ncbi:MAG: poly-beta-1,6-N-acetyl-D-glucosamine biosynthesis protein PgaD [Pseudomonadota bacterium]